MCGREAAHYASANKPSWIMLLCSCLWMQADRASYMWRRNVTAFLRETSQNNQIQDVTKQTAQSFDSESIWLMSCKERTSSFKEGRDRSQRWTRVLRLSLPVSWFRDQNPAVLIASTGTWGSSGNPCLKCSWHKWPKVKHACLFCVNLYPGPCRRPSGGGSEERSCRWRPRFSPSLGWWCRSWGPSPGSLGFSHSLDGYSSPPVTETPEGQISLQNTPVKSFMGIQWEKHSVLHPLHIL